MLMLKIKKNLALLLLPKTTATTNLVNLVHFSSKTLNSSSRSNPIAEYLINSCGFSSRNAASASKNLSKSASIDQAHSVRHFFEHCGFHDTCIRKLISNHPHILSADVDKTLKPNLQTLRDMGFTQDEVQVLIASNPRLLVSPLALPRLEFWQNFLGANNSDVLVRIFRRNRNLISLDIVSGIAPKIALLKEHGLSKMDIIGILRRGPLIGLSFKSIEATLKRANELGFCTQSSCMLARGISALCSSNGSGEFNKKLEFFKEFGWSEEEFLSAFRRYPSIISLSKDNIRKTMEFLVGRAGCKQPYIASNPGLLKYSLEKRLKPRHYMMEMLKANNLIVRECSFLSIISLTDNNFVERFILRHKERVPKIHVTYIAACAGQIPL